MESPLETIVALQRALTELATLDKQLSGIPDWMEELHGRHSARKAEIEQIEATLLEVRTQRRTAEGQVNDLQEKIKTYQEQISRVRNQREYGALLQEIDTAKEQTRGFEEQALEALEAQDENQKRLDEEREAFSELDTQYKEALAKWEQEKPQLAERAEQLRSNVADLEPKIAPGTLNLFHRILQKHNGQALAPVGKSARATKGPQNWHCGGCNYRVRPQAVVEITDQGRIVLCDNCQRILFFDGDD